MSNTFASFSELDLSTVTEAKGVSILQPGTYDVRVANAEWQEMNNGNGHQVMVELEDVDGGGSIRHWINVHHKTSKQAQEIGQRQLKSLLQFGGHPSPDKPGDIATLRGLHVGVVIGMSKERRNPNTGQVMVSRPEVKGYRMPASDSAPVPENSAAQEFDDALPDF